MFLGMIWLTDETQAKERMPQKYESRNEKQEQSHHSQSQEGIHSIHLPGGTSFKHACNSPVQEPSKERRHRALCGSTQKAAGRGASK